MVAESTPRFKKSCKARGNQPPYPPEGNRHRLECRGDLLPKALFPDSLPCYCSAMPSRLRRFPYLSAVILGALVARLVVAGLSGWGVAALVITALWFGVEFLRWLMPPDEFARQFPPSEASPEAGGASDRASTLISLVYFLNEPRKADEAAIRQCVCNALGLEGSGDDEAADCLVLPFAPPDTAPGEDHILHYMVRIPEGLFAVLVSAKPYIEDPKGFAKRSIRDKRLRTAVESHLAWISVDLMEEIHEPEAARRAYRIIGKMLASMAGPDCLAIYCPELQRCNEFDPVLLEALTSQDPLALFNEPTFDPIIEIADHHPKMVEAVREAVDRWPEFVAAFRTCAPADRERHIVKAEFREGRKAEYMWVAVSEITDNSVTGMLLNDPHELIEVHRGAIVTFTLDRLNDWIYPGPEGSHVGGFTLDVLAEED